MSISTQEKTRFDRSVNENEVKNTENDDANKQWSFTDDVTVNDFIVLIINTKKNIYIYIIHTKLILF